jgi:hypothetical protein
MSLDLTRLFAGLDRTSLDALASRREALAAGGRLATAAALTAVPVALASTARRAFASSSLPDAVVRVFNFALTLEYLEATFYNRGVSSGVIPSGTPRRVFEIIQAHENAHVAFLKQTLGADAVPKPEFDFTAGGALPNPFKHYEVFTILAQAFEDTGVRAYKGQAGALKPYDEFLTAALTIHSIEARHASEVRRLNGAPGWIPFENPGAPASTKPVYQGEDQTSQLGIDLTKFERAGFVTQSFDEPLTRAEVLAIAGPFIKQ